MKWLEAALFDGPDSMGHGMKRIECTRAIVVRTATPMRAAFHVNEDPPEAPGRSLERQLAAAISRTSAGTDVTLQPVPH